MHLLSTIYFLNVVVLNFHAYDNEASPTSTTSLPFAVSGTHDWRGEQCRVDENASLYKVLSFQPQLHASPCRPCDVKHRIKRITTI